MSRKGRLYEGFNDFNSSVSNIESEELFERELEVLHEMKMSAKNEKDKKYVRDVAFIYEALAYIEWDV